MLKRSYSTQESLARYWALQAVALSQDIEDESLVEPSEQVLEGVEMMRNDRRVVLIGADNCGKSELLAGMVGCPVLARVMPQHHFLRWRYLDSDGDTEHCRFIPEPALWGMELVNTRDCAHPDVAAAVAPLLPESDAVVAVVDARAYESAPVWDLLAPLPAEDGPACVLALTHVELLDATTSVTLTERVREWCRNRIGRVIPVYQVQVSKPAQMDEFGSRVVEAMENSGGGLRAAIREVMRRGSNLLYKQGSVLKARDAVVRTDTGFLQGVEQEIDQFQSRQAEGVRNCVLNYASAAQRCMPHLLHQLRRSLGWFISPVVLIRLENYGAACENLYYSLVLDDVSQQQEELDKQFVVSCGSHWRDVRPRMKQSLHCDIGDFPVASLEAELSALRQRLQAPIHEPFRALKIRSAFASLFKRHVDWMRFMLSCFCAAITAAGLLGYAAQEGLAYVFLITAAVIWLLGSLLHVLVVRKICSKVRTSAEPLRESLVEYMAPLVTDMINSRVAAYRRLYTEPRQKVADYETSLVPLQQRQSEIFRQLRSAVPRV